jgi:hypothetical protein
VDADFEIVEEAFDPPSWNGRQPRRFCQGCIGRWMATMSMTRTLDIPARHALVGQHRHAAARRHPMVTGSANDGGDPVPVLAPLADPLAAFPARRSEILIGYARVSTGGQNLERQIDALTAAECRRVFADTKSGKTAQRPELEACHAFTQGGDTLVVPSLDHYGRSVHDLISMVAEPRRREIGFTSFAREPRHHHPRRTAHLRLRRPGRVQRTGTPQDTRGRAQAPSTKDAKPTFQPAGQRAGPCKVRPERTFA